MPGSLNTFQVSYWLNGKKKDLDTNFTIRIYSNKQLIHVSQAFSKRVESNNPKTKYQRISSIIKIPVMKLDSMANLYAEIEMDRETLRFSADEWVFQDSLKFYDSFGLLIVKFTNPKKMAKNKVRFGRFTYDKPIPKKEDFPVFLIGWQLEEVILPLAYMK